MSKQTGGATVSAKVKMVRTYLDAAWLRLGYNAFLSQVRLA